MRLAAIAFVTLLSSLMWGACEAEKHTSSPRQGPPVVRIEAPQPPAPAPAPRRDSLKIGPGGITVEQTGPDREQRVDIALPRN